MPRVDFAGPSARDSATVAANPTRLVNLYREPSGTGYVLRPVLGMQEWASLGTAMMRDMAVVRGALYVAAGGRLSKVSADGTAIDIGAIGNDTKVSLSSNEANVTVASGGVLRVWDGTTLEEVTVAPFASIGSVVYCGTYSLVSELDGKRIAWSDIAVPTTWDGLNFATAGIVDEEITRLVVLTDTVFVFGPTSCERWSVTGEANANAFARIGGGEVDVGLPYYACVARFPGGFAFVGSNGTVNLWLGALVAIGTPAVNAAIAGNTPQSMFYYEARGHGFLVLTFGNRPAWVYDMATKEWHERAEGVEGAWSARAAAWFSGAWRVGANSGRIGRLAESRADYGSPLIRRAVSPRFDAGKPVTVALIEAFPRKGQDREADIDYRAVTEIPEGASVEDDTDGAILVAPGWDSGAAQIGLRLSSDGGLSFGKLRMRDVGDRGDFDKRVTWRALGQHRTVTVEISTAARDELPMEATLNVEFA